MAHFCEEESPIDQIVGENWKRISRVMYKVQEPVSYVSYGSHRFRRNSFSSLSTKDSDIRSLFQTRRDLVKLAQTCLFAKQDELNQIAEREIKLQDIQKSLKKKDVSVLDRLKRKRGRKRSLDTQEEYSRLNKHEKAVISELKKSEPYSEIVESISEPIFVGRKRRRQRKRSSLELTETSMASKEEKIENQNSARVK